MSDKLTAAERDDLYTWSFAVLCALQKPHWSAEKIARLAPVFAKRWLAGEYFTIKPLHDVQLPKKKR